VQQHLHLHRQRPGPASSFLSSEQQRAPELPILTVKRPPRGSWPVVEDGAPTKVLAVKMTGQGQFAFQNVELSRRRLELHAQRKLASIGISRSFHGSATDVHQLQPQGVRWFFLDAAVVDGWRQQQEEWPNLYTRDRLHSVALFLATFTGLVVTNRPDTIEVEQLHTPETGILVDKSVSTLVAPDLSAKLIRKNSRKGVQEAYAFSQDTGTLGEGGYGIVYRGTHRGTGAERALKRVQPQSQEEVEALKREVEAQTAMDHPNVCRLVEFFDSGSDLWIVTELCRGGELCDLFERFPRGLPEAEAAQIFHPIARATHHCHSKSVLHRDIKPENVLLSGSGTLQEQPRLIDFGFASRTPYPSATSATGASTSASARSTSSSSSSSTSTSGASMATSSSPSFSSYSSASSISSSATATPSSDLLPGTIFYSSPQVLNGECSSEGDDIWSLGVVLHILLTGCFPFPAQACESDEALKAYVQSGKLRGHLEAALPELNLSKDARDLLQGLLAYDPEDRITMSEALKHPFLRSMDANRSSSQTLSQEEMRDRLVRFSKLGVVRRLAACAMVRLADNSLIPDQQRTDLHTAFAKLDVHGDGRIHTKELQQLLESPKNAPFSKFWLANTTSDIASWFSWDPPMGGSCSRSNAAANILQQKEGMGYTTFIAAMIFGSKGYSALSSDERLFRNVFELIDADHDEVITVNDLKSRFGMADWESRRAMVEALDSIGKRNDGLKGAKLQFLDFVRLMRAPSSRLTTDTL